MMNKVNFGKNTFCGPSVISAIAGCTTDEAEALIQSVRGNRKKVVGAYLSELTEVFRELNYSVSSLRGLENQSIFSSMFRIRDDGYYVFLIPGHFIAIEVNGNNRFICDNHTKSPINLSNSARLNQKVLGVIRVIK